MRASRLTPVVAAVGVAALAMAAPVAPGPGVSTAEAQTIASAERARHAGASGLLESPARLLVRDASLSLALARLSESSGVPIAYSSSVLARETGGVSCACEEVSVGAALTTLLAGTPYDFAELVGQVVVFAVPSTAPRDALRAFEELLRGDPVTPLRLANFAVAAPTSVARLPRAQQGPVAGVVVEAGSRRPLAGAQVVVEGTDRGAITDPRGRFRIENVPGGQATLRAVMIGYRTATQAVRVGDTAITIELAESAIELDQIVVTGTPGEAQKRSIGNAIATLDAAEVVEAAPIRGVGDLLNGRVAGVVVMPGTGVVGGGPRIQVRGRSTISLQLEPLVYIDGIRVNNDVATGPAGTPPVASRLGDLNPEEIESIEVIRGPAAATLYGTEASNGVIQIITKKGAAGERPQFGLSIRQGGNWFMDPEGRIPHNFRRVAATGEIIEQDLVAQEAARGVPLFRTGHTQGYDLDLSGSAGMVRYYLAAGYDREEGIQPDNAFRRMTGRANITVAPSDRFDVSANVGVIRANRDLSMDRGLSLMFALLFADPNLRDTPYRGFIQAPPEVWWDAYETFQDVDRYIAGVQMNHRPTSWLTHRLRFGVDQATEDNQYLVELQPDSIAQFLGTLDRSGRKIVNRRNRNVTTFDYGATADVPVTGRVRSATSVGAQYYRDFSEGQYSEGRGFPMSGVKLVTAAAQTFGGDDFIENTTVGLYVQQQFSLNERLFVTGAVRADDNSAFGSDFELVTYPKVSGSWIVSEEPFWNLGFVDALKLRAAYGQSGLQPQAFAALRTYRPTTGGQGSSISPLAVGNPDLGPERGEEIELGFEAGLFDGRLGLDFTYYNKRTEDMILLRDVAPSTGFPQAQFINAGAVSNKGLELLLNASPVRTPGVSWDVTLNLATNDSEILDLDPDNPSLTFISINRPPQAEIRNAEGYPIGSRFSKRVVSADFDPATGRAINVLCDGGPGAGALPCADAPALYMGRPTPKYEAGVTNTLRFGFGLALHTQLDYKGGHVKFDQDTQARCVIFQVCEVNVRPEDFDPIDVAYAQLGGAVGAKYLPDASFVKLREVGLSYTVPEAWAGSFGARQATVRVAARNLHTWTDYTSLDPESLDLSALASLSSYYEQTTTPQLATLLASVRVTW